MAKFKVHGYMPDRARPESQWAKAYPPIEAENRTEAREKFLEMFPGYTVDLITEVIQ